MKSFETRCVVAVIAAVGAAFVVPSAHGQCAFEERLKIVANDGAAGDAYGSSIAVDGDMLVVGAPLDDGVHVNSGAAYVYRKINGAWTEEAKLTSHAPAAFDHYGIAVDVEGDVIVVGSFYDDDSYLDDGSAFVYRYDGASWNPEQQLVASDADHGDRLGRSLDIEGSWLAVAAYRSDHAGTDSGSVLMYRFDGASWVEMQRLIASDAADGDLFGVDVSLSGDRLLVGSYFDDTIATNTGSAYVFRYDGTSWIEEQKLTSSDAVADDQLGATVALEGTTAVLGSYGDDAAGISSGAAYVFELQGGTWNEMQELVGSDTTPGDEFGWVVSMQGDVLAVGAYRDDDAAHEGGSAYIYRQSGVTWIEERKLLPSDAGGKDWFASSIVVDGDSVWVGAMEDDAPQSDSGSAYAYDIRALALNANAATVTQGDTLTLVTSPGVEGDLAGLFVVELAGTPTFVPLVALAFDSTCSMNVPIVVPAGVAGIDVAFQSFGYTITGKVEATNVVDVSFQ